MRHLARSRGAVGAEGRCLRDLGAPHMNPSSSSKSFETFTAQLARAKPWQEILLQLGEVDCGFLIWRRADRHGLSVEDQLAQTLDSYAGFIERVLGGRFRRVIVVSVPLQTIEHYPSALGDVATLRKTVTSLAANGPR